MERMDEVYLIRRVKEEQDTIALRELVNRYRPLINGAKLNFYLRNFDQDDWEQEALSMTKKGQKILVRIIEPSFITTYAHF